MVKEQIQTRLYLETEKKKDYYSRSPQPAAQRYNMTVQIKSQLKNLIVYGVLRREKNR